MVYMGSMCVPVPGAGALIKILSLVASYMCISLLLHEAVLIISRWASFITLIGLEWPENTPLDLSKPLPMPPIYFEKSQS